MGVKRGACVVQLFLILAFRGGISCLVSLSLDDMLAAYENGTQVDSI